ncbi:hypothetical protein AB0F20_10270 [Streptomyces goshikiensis]|uniref:hypothetical protein n=1 Tax=Streptomyces goshikiensis TaxID=1942 RepID=UPI0033D08ADE
MSERGGQAPGRTPHSTRTTQAADTALSRAHGSKVPARKDAAVTATTVNGIRILASEAVEAPISTPGKPVYYKQTRRLLLANDTQLYGCVHCDFADPRIGTVRIHLKQHRSAATPPAAAPRSAPARAAAKKAVGPTTTPAPEDTGLQDGLLASLTLGQLIKRAQAANEVIKERDLARKERDAAREELTEWMNRAAKAEHGLDTIRKALTA